VDTQSIHLHSELFHCVLSRDHCSLVGRADCGGFIIGEDVNSRLGASLIITHTFIRKSKQGVKPFSEGLAYYLAGHLLKSGRIIYFKNPYAARLRQGVSMEARMTAGDNS